MSDRENRSQYRRFLFTAGACCIALALDAGLVASQTSEVDSYDAAVTSQSKAEALRFIKTFASSHLVGDLIESLPPQVAREVCAELNGSGPAKARKACDALPKALVAQPAVPASEAAPGANDVMVEPLSPGAAAAAGVLPDEDPADEQAADEIDNADGIEVLDRPNAGIAPAGGGIAGATLSAATDTGAGISSGAQSGGMEGANDTVTSDDTDLMYSPGVEVLPAASSTVAAPLSTGAEAGAGTPPDVAPTLGQAAGDADDATDLFNGAVAEVAPAAGETTANAVSCSVAMTSSTPSGGDTQSCRSNTKRDKSEGGKSIPPVAGTVSVVSTTAAISVTTSTSASTGIQPDPAPDTANSESSKPESNSTESSSAESDNAQSSSGQSSSGQSSSDQSSSGQSSSGESSSSNDQASNSQSGSADSSKGKGKSKGDKAKGDKGSKGKGKGGSKGPS